MNWPGGVELELWEVVQEQVQDRIWVRALARKAASSITINLPHQAKSELWKRRGA